MADVPVPASDASDRKSHPRLRTGAGLPNPGDVIAGKYALVRLIGEGGMGVVFEATHVRLRQRLAIKILRPDVADFGEVITRFEREARAAAQLQSIHTARVIDVETLPNGLPYIVLEYLEGRDLDAEIEGAGPMPVEEAIDVVLQVADAMSEAHALGIVHRDLKPSNLFVCRVEQSGRRVIKVLDFGISKSETEDRRLTPTHAYFGTPYYAAPEQLRAASAADARSDVWSLGCILFELLTGRTPFIGTPTSVIAKVVAEPIPWPTELRPELPRDLARVVVRALQRDPTQRFQNMREFARALQPYGPKETIAAAVAEAPRGRGKLGEILVADGLLTQPDLERALTEQRRSGKLLGRVLLDLGLVSQVDLLTALAKQQGVIVTPEAPSPSLPDPAWEAKTTPPAGTEIEEALPALPRRRIPWTPLAAAVGFLVAVMAVWLAMRGRAHHEATGLVAVGSAHAVPAVALAPAALGGASTEAAEPSRSAAAPLPAAPLHAPRARAQAPRGSATFEPSGI
ncbi:MAG TPA: protein kinase [Polyangiaceae bacterium]|jgi:serine/threonine-protein kinase